jgi:serine/threonine protein kinase
VGRYELLRRLARGGMAELYLARAVGIHGFEKLCVLKLVLPHLAEDREFVEMFLREARIAARLDHPSIAHVSDIGELDGEPFFVMQFIHGRDLRTIVTELGESPLPMSAALTIARDLAAGLHYVHERKDGDGKPLGLVHRDVSPSNVMVGYDGDIKLVDFGIAKSTEQRSSTRTGVLKGKVAYMSPEQCHGRKIDRRTDVFNLGILLYEMTTGQRLFAGDNDFYVMTRIVRGMYARPSEVKSDYPEALEAIVERALQVDPEDRYPTAEALQADLESAAADRGIRLSNLSVAKFMRNLYGEQPRPEDDDPLDADPTEIRDAADASPARRGNPSATRIGSIERPSLTDTRIGPADAASKGRGDTRIGGSAGVATSAREGARSSTRLGPAALPRRERTLALVPDAGPRPTASVGDIRLDLDTLADELQRTEPPTVPEPRPPAPEPDSEADLDETRIATRSSAEMAEIAETASDDDETRSHPRQGDTQVRPHDEDLTELFIGDPTERLAPSAAVATGHTAIAMAPRASIGPRAPAIDPPSRPYPVTPMPSGLAMAPMTSASYGLTTRDKRPGVLRWVVIAVLALGLGTLTAAMLSEHGQTSPVVRTEAAADMPAEVPDPESTPPAPEPDADPIAPEPEDVIPAPSPMDVIPQPPPEPAPGVPEAVPTEVAPTKPANRRRRDRAKKKKKKSARPLDGMYPSG